MATPADLVEALVGVALMLSFGGLIAVGVTCVFFEVRDWRRRPRPASRRTIRVYRDGEEVGRA